MAVGVSLPCKLEFTMCFSSTNNYLLFIFAVLIFPPADRDIRLFWDPMGLGEAGGNWPLEAEGAVRAKEEADGPAGTQRAL